MKRGRKHKHNRIWMFFGVAFAVCLSLYSIRNAVVSVVALEQTARCGAEEHIHNAECYTDGDLTCGRITHTHHRNCYLILLKDNDINRLLSQVDANRNNSLESLIHQAVGTALRYNSDLISMQTGTGFQYVSLNAASVAYDSLDAEIDTAELNIAALNETIAENEIEPEVVFNEDLYQAGTVEVGPQDTALLGGVTLAAAQADTGISTLALGADPETSQGNSNIYIYLDGSWECIGTIPHSSSWNVTKYTAYFRTSNLIDLINDTMGSSLTAGEIGVHYAQGLTSSYSEGIVGGTTTTLGTNYGKRSDARAAKYVRVMDADGEPLEFCTVKLNYLNGTTDVQYVQRGDLIVLPALSDGYLWYANGVAYTAGQSVEITAATTFTVGLGEGKIWVSYNVNFPVSGYDFYYSVSAPDSTPTLEGTAVTVINDPVEEEGSITVRNVSETLVRAETGHPKDFTYPIRFAGWETETGELLSPNTALIWDVLETYAGADNVVELTGVWNHGRENTVNFFILHNAQVDQTTGNANDYTTSIYSTYMGGTIDTSFNLNASNDTVAYANDQVIRAMYGSSGSMWFASFPSDEYIFEQLRTHHINDLTVDGESVDIDELTTNADAYMIRWYMIKYDSGDGWHIDGKLTRKKGQITVDKEFFGETAAITQAENGFHLVACNGTYTNGVFTPYTYGTDSAYRQCVLVLDQATKTNLQSTYPHAEFLIYDSMASFSDGEGYEWLIEDVELGEHWQIKEFPPSVEGYMYYAEYSVYDTDGNTSAIAEYGTTASVVGRTFALDEDPDQGLLVDFRNYYYPTESILIKKEDADTGQPIGGAVFELWQYNSENELQQLRFEYDSATGQYRYNSSGSVSQIATGNAGYTTIATTDISYSHGDLVVKEVVAPSGYDTAPNVRLAEKDDGVSIVGMSYPNGDSVAEEKWGDFAEMHDNGTVLVVKDCSTKTTSVTVNKVWADGSAEDSVTMVLQANGGIATALFPGLPNVRATLTEADNWKYTWTGLPTYANGSPVTWSVKEIMVGDETTLSDGVSFANWTVVYAQPVKTDSDADGLADNWSCTVTNSARRAQLYLLKTDSLGTALAGAAFELIEVDNAGNPVSGAVARTGVTDSSGLLRFDNLKYTTRYRLVETGAPAGYESYITPAYLYLTVDGTVTVESHGHVTAGDYAYMVRVVNYAPPPLPETGGSGPGGYYAIGTVLMLLAVCGYILPKRKKGGVFIWVM